MAFDPVYYQEKKDKLIEELQTKKDDCLQQMANTLFTYLKFQEDINKKLEEIDQRAKEHMENEQNGVAPVGNADDTAVTDGTAETQATEGQEETTTADETAEQAETQE